MMRRIGILVVGLLLWASASFAQNTSTTMMAVAQSTQFTNRLQYLMVEQAQTVMGEVQVVTGNGNANFNYSATCHAARYRYAVQVLISPGAAAGAAAVLIVSANFAGGVIVSTATGSGNTADSTANDTALLTAIQNDWNALSGVGCVANP